MSVVFHFPSIFQWLIGYYETTREKRFIFGLININIGVCGLSFSSNFSIKFIKIWKTLQWVCGSPGTELLFFVCVEYTKPSFIGLSFLINSLHQNHKPQERKRFIFGLLNVGFGVCGLSFLINSSLQNHRREKDSFLD